MTTTKRFTRLFCLQGLLFILLLHPVRLPAQEPGPQAPGERAPAGLPVQQGERLSLNRCVEIALKTNPGIIAAANSVEGSRHRLGQARANYYPQVAAQGSYSKIDSGNDAPALPGSPGSYEQYNAGITVNQNLLDFGRTSSRVAMQKYTLDSARFDMDSTTDQIIFNVKQAYYGVLQADRSREVAAEIVKQFQKHLDLAKGFYEVGVKARIDVTRAEVDLSNARLSLIRAENAFKIARVVLNNAMGVPRAPEYSLEDELAIHQFEISFDDALARAYENRPDLRSIAARREASKEAIELARAGHYPVLSANAGYNWSGRDFPLDEGWSAGIALTIPLFNGFLTSRQTAEAKSNLFVLSANEEALKQQVLLDIQQAYLNLQEARDSIATAELAVKQGEENLALANGRYAAGVGSPIEVTDALTAYANAQGSYTRALYGYKIAQASVEKAMGAR